MRGRILLLFILIFSIMANAAISDSFTVGGKDTKLDEVFKKDDCYRLVDLLVKDASKSSDLGVFVNDTGVPQEISDEASKKALGELKTQADGIIAEIKELPKKKCITGDGSIVLDGHFENDNGDLEVISQSNLGNNLNILSKKTFTLASGDNPGKIKVAGLNQDGNSVGSISVSAGKKGKTLLTWKIDDLDNYKDSAFADPLLSPKVVGLKVNYETSDEGSFWHFVKENLKDKAVYIKTPTAVAGVRGSNLVIENTPEGENWKVVHGEAVINDLDGNQITINDKEQLSVAGDEAVVEEASFTSEELVGAFATEHDDKSNEELKQIVNEAKDEYNIIDPENFDSELEQVTTDERDQQVVEVKEEQKVIEETKEEVSSTASSSSSGFKIGEFEVMKELNNFIERLRNKDKFAIFTLVIVVLIIFWLRR